jgi:hypothetical protein
MVIVKIVGGLGNQMFCYAYAKALEKKGYKVKIDISAYKTYALHGGYQLDKYNVNLEISTQEENKNFYKNDFLTKVLRKIGFDNSKILKEKSLFFDINFLDMEDNNYVSGYFQSEKYFMDIENLLLEQFAIKEEISSYGKELEKSIINLKNSCSIHVRRGDYLEGKNSSIHGLLNLNYYKKSIDHIKNKDININFFIFSDEIDWVKENFKIDNAIYVESKGEKLPHEDIYLMSLCKNNIIANSSFSWWGAWLNQDEDKVVIAPKKWFSDENMLDQSKDIVPDNWLKI